MQPLITRSFEFAAAHRLLHHESKCRFVHGHQYVAEVTVIARNGHLDTIGRVIDFGDLKQIVGGWIDDEWDHNFIINPNDPLLTGLFDHDCDFEGVNECKPFIMPEEYANPTVENMAIVLGRKCSELLRDSAVRPTHLRLYETPRCWVDLVITE